MTPAKRTKPPTFPYLPKSRAKRLKESWIQDHKIRSKWRAQKKRQGLAVQTSDPVEDTPSHPHGEADPDSKSHTSPDHPHNLPMPTPSHDKQSLRDLRRLAYAPTQKSDHSHPKRAPVSSPDDSSKKVARGREAGQPNMKMRMNVLLEKIKRDFS